MLGRGRGIAALSLVGLAAAAAGCGGGSSSSSGGEPTVTIRPIAQPKRQCNGSKLARKREAQRRKLNADLRRLRSAAKTVRHYSQQGNAAINREVDRFMLDVAEENIPVHERSRYIDKAAAIVSTRCFLCFQALEANRPIAAGAKLACD